LKDFASKTDFLVLRHVEPLFPVHVLLHHRIRHVQRAGGDDDLALRRGGIGRIKRDRAADAIGAAVDGFERRVELEDGVVDAPSGP
jgi:hypothetical protein